MADIVAPHRAFRRLATAGAALAVSTLGAVVLAAPTPAAADAVRNEQWQLRALDMATAWHFSAGAGVIVGVLDSGVDATHPDLAGQVLPGLDLVDGSTGDGRADPVGHGTSVAALIAGRADDGRGVVGIAPQAKILPVRVLNMENTYDDAAVVARGLRWAVDQGASVVNLSLGGADRSAPMAEALRYAATRNVVVIACTGNSGVDPSGSNRIWYPAREVGVVAVGGLAAAPPRRSAGGSAGGSATGPAGRSAPGPAGSPGSPLGSPAGASGTYGGPSAAATAATAIGEASHGGAAGTARERLWPGSLTGPQTVLTAPGADLLAARPGGYWRVQGTSFAAPLVTATAALIRARWPTMSAANVINRLVRTAQDLGAHGRDDRYGYGEVNPVGALTWPVPEVAANPLVGGAAPAGPDASPVAPPQVRPEPGQPQPSTAPDGSAAPGPAASASTDASSSAAAQRADERSTRSRLALSLVVGSVVFATLLLIGLVLARGRWPGRGRGAPGG